MSGYEYYNEIEKPVENGFRDKSPGFMFEESECDPTYIFRNNKENYNFVVTWEIPEIDSEDEYGYDYEYYGEERPQTLYVVKTS